MKNKKIFILTSLLLTSCNTNKLDVSIYAYNLEDTFIASLVSSIELEMKEKNYKYTIFDSKNSQIEQNRQLINDIENDNSSVFVLNMVDRLAASSIISKVKKTNKPIIFFNREPLLSDLNLYEQCYYVGTNPYLEGTLQAEMTASLFGDPQNLNKEYDKNGDNKIQLVLLKGEIAHQDSELRSNAYLETLKEKGYEVEVLTSRYCSWEKEKGYEEMKNVYQEFSSQIEMISSNNDDMALGAIEYLKTQNVFNNNYLPIIGVDGTTNGKKAIEEGFLYGTVINDNVKQAKMISYFINCFVNNKKIDISLSNNHCIYIDGKTLTKKSL